MVRQPSFLPVRAILLVALGLAALPPMRTDAEQPAHRPPNFIVILADDLGAKELACYGHPTHRTPHLDALAAGGVKFETCFTSPVCHPTRFTVMTGQYGCHTGVYNFAGMRGGPPVKHEGADDITQHLTFGQVLSQAGYATALAGKWQLSGAWPHVIREAGFGEYCVWGYREYYSPEDADRVVDAGIDFRDRYWRPSIIQNGEWLPTGPDDYGPDLQHAFLADFIRRQGERPFFIYYPMCLTHGPWLPTPQSVQPGDDRTKSNKANFAANVAQLDTLVGRLVAVLDEQGLRDDTLLIFTGDNGTGGDGKSTATELGARVPLIIDGPGLVEPRGSTLALADTSDIFPTLLELAGVPLPTDRPIDGRSLARFLRGEQETTRDWIFAYQADRRILRTERWLLEDNSPLHYGRLYDCGQRRDGVGYRDVTELDTPKIRAVRAEFDRLLAKLPAPVLEDEGPPNERLDKQPRPRRAERSSADGAMRRRR